MQQEERIARAHFALYARLLRHIHCATSPQTRRHVETASFIAVLHALALFALLHVSFVGPNESCLAPFLPLQVSRWAPSDTHLLRIQVIPSNPCAADDRACVARETRPLASFVFASQRGFLSLLDEPAMLRQLNVQRRDAPLVVVPRSSACFDLRWFGQSSPLWDAFLDRALGYDTIVLNHLLRWRRGDGVLLNEATGRIHDVGFGAFTSQTTKATWLKRLLVKLQTLYLCVSLFFVCVGLIAFLIHESHMRMLIYADLVGHHIDREDHVNFTRALGAHCAQSLMLVPVALGMMFFLVELYKDYVLAFGMLGVVGLGECYSIFCARSKMSQLFYPPLFFGWFALYHIYLAAFPFGFSHFGLAVFAMTLSHTMIFFTNCFELPALLTGSDMSNNHTHREPLALR